MDFSKLKLLTIPEGEVVKIEYGGIIFWVRAISRLPSEYQEVKYVRKVGASQAYIDLGFAFDTAATIHINYTDLATNPSGYVFGAAEDSGVFRCMLSAGSSGVTMYGSNTTNSIGAFVDATLLNGLERNFIATLKAGKLQLEEALSGQINTNGTQKTYTMTNNLYLFGQNYNGAPRVATFDFHISVFKYYDKDDKLISELVPCYRKSDMEVGMYDLVRKQFLTASNTDGMGRLVAGSEVVDIETLKNWAKCSTEADGETIYNYGAGYKLGYRIRSGGAEQEQDSAVCTGLIPFTKGDKLYIYPPFTGLNTVNAINFFSESQECLGQICDDGTGYGICANAASTAFLTTQDYGVSVLDLSNNTEERVNDIAFVRITNNTTLAIGEDMLITKNEKVVNINDSASLPSDYQKVEWIQADTNIGAYIDLGFAYDCGAKICLGQWILNDTATYPFGASENGGAIRTMISSPYDSASVGYFSNSSSGYRSIACTYAKDVLNELVVIYSGGSFVCQNLTTDACSGSPLLNSYKMTNNLYLFAQNYNGSPRFGGIRRISYLKYYDKTDTLICDLVPCYRRSDGVIGMYDLVRKMFLTNVGSGTFTKGLDTGNLASPLPNNTTDTTQWVNGYRFSSSGISAQSGTTLSNEIPITFGDVIRIKGVTLRNSEDRWRFAFELRDTKDLYYNYNYYTNNCVAGVVTYLTYNGYENGVYTYTVTSETAGHTPKSFRFAMPTPTDPSSVIITVNEEIE